MPTAPRTVPQALAFAKAEHDNETQDWTNYCQRFVRSCYGIPALFSSAWAQWVGADDEDKHPGTDPSLAPVGAALCFRGGTYGHIMLAAHPADGVDRAWSNDLVRQGDIDIVRRTAPVLQWGHVYVGWLSAVNDYDLNVPTGKPPRPKEDKPYRRIEIAIGRLERAAENALKLNERRDAKVIRAEINHLREVYAELRHR